MNCPSCLGENTERAGFCDFSGEELQPEPPDRRCADPRTCVSCGRTMDQTVYFTMCPHCGFNYRIEVFPIDSEEKLTIRSLVPSLLAGAVVACAILALLLLT
jgi:hypothetical protein